MKRATEMDVAMTRAVRLAAGSGLVGGIVGGMVGGVLYASGALLSQFLDPSNYLQGSFPVIELFVAGEGANVLMGIAILLVFGLVGGAGLGGISGISSGLLAGAVIALIGKQLDWLEVGTLWGIATGIIVVLAIIGIRGVGVSLFYRADYDLVFFLFGAAMGGLVGGLVAGKVFQKQLTRQERDAAAL